MYKRQEYLKEERYKVDLFDVPLHYNMYQASKQGRDYDLSKILDGTLVQNHPTLAVTFVDNHDSQWGSSLESAVEDWFKPSAYALILLMKEGYPCIFYGDYYGVSGNPPMHRGIIDNLLEIRKNHEMCIRDRGRLVRREQPVIGSVRREGGSRILPPRPGARHAHPRKR